VQGNVVQITPQVAGTVVAIHLADDTDFVRRRPAAGQLDAADARRRWSTAEAQLAQTVREVRTLYANNGALQPRRCAARGRRWPAPQAELARAAGRRARRAPLVASGAVGKEE
jgi:membrane fusion protein (multidrug efflux system)